MKIYVDFTFISLSCLLCTDSFSTCLSTVKIKLQTILNCSDRIFLVYSSLSFSLVILNSAMISSQNLIIFSFCLHSSKDWTCSWFGLLYAIGQLYLGDSILIGNKITCFTHFELMGLTFTLLLKIYTSFFPEAKRTQ